MKSYLLGDDMSNLVDLKAFRDKKKELKIDGTDATDFKAIALLNQEKKEAEAKERARTNKNVLHAYKIDFKGEDK
jgi:hypothetical protein